MMLEEVLKPIMLREEGEEITVEREESMTRTAARNAM